MGQLIQKLKSAKLDLVSVSLPQPGQGEVLIRNLYSVLPPGTLGKELAPERRKLIEKSALRQAPAKYEFTALEKHGISAASGMNTNKLDSVSPYGYSCAGEVLAVGDEVNSLLPGDLVAIRSVDCSHAELLLTDPLNCIKLHPEIHIQEAAFIGFAGAAFQNIRKAKVKKGDSCLVFGLDLPGILTVKILLSLGIRAVAIDYDVERITHVRETFGFVVKHIDLANFERINPRILRKNDFDAAIIATTANAEISKKIAEAHVREKGLIVSGRLSSHAMPDQEVGNKSELPGKNLTKQGVQTTHNETNSAESEMLFIADLLSKNKLRFYDLISDTCHLQKIPGRYEKLVESQQEFFGLLIEFLPSHKLNFSSPPSKPVETAIGVIGMGKHSRQTMLPALKKLTSLNGIATHYGINEVFADTKFNFDFGTKKTQRLFDREFINTVFIFSRNNLHASQLTRSLKAGNHTFVEKPLCISLEELNYISDTYTRLPKPFPNVMIGFNHRFAPAVVDALKFLEGQSSLSIQIRVNAERLPADHWKRDPEIGGGLIISEMCQYIDLACFLAGKRALCVTAKSSDRHSDADDDITLSLQFHGGSMAKIIYSSVELKRQCMEEIEVVGGEGKIKISNYSTLVWEGSKRRKKLKYRKAHLGYQQEIKKFIDSVHEGKYAPISFKDILTSTRIAILAQKAWLAKKLEHL